MAKKEQNEPQLRPICRNCFYRRNEGDMSYYNGISRNKSICAYIIIEDEPRGCTPTDDACERFRPRIPLNLGTRRRVF